MSNSGSSGPAAGGCLGFAAVALGTAFVVLKLCNVINWSWWWVTAPFWGYALFLLVVVFFMVVLLVALR